MSKPSPKSRVQAVYPLAFCFYDSRQNIAGYRVSLSSEHKIAADGKEPTYPSAPEAWRAAARSISV